MAFASAQQRPSTEIDVRPFGPTGAFSHPLGLPFPAEIGRDGFGIGHAAIFKTIDWGPFGPIAVFSFPLGLPFPFDIGRDGFRIGPAATLHRN